MASNYGFSREAVNDFDLWNLQAGETAHFYDPDLDEDVFVQGWGKHVMVYSSMGFVEAKTVWAALAALDKQKQSFLKEWKEQQEEDRRARRTADVRARRHIAREAREARKEAAEFNRRARLEAERRAYVAKMEALTKLPLISMFADALRYELNLRRLDRENPYFARGRRLELD